MPLFFGANSLASRRAGEDTFTLEQAISARSARHQSDMDSDDEEAAKPSSRSSRSCARRRVPPGARQPMRDGTAVQSNRAAKGAQHLPLTAIGTGGKFYPPSCSKVASACAVSGSP